VHVKLVLQTHDARYMQYQNVSKCIKISKHVGVLTIYKILLIYTGLFEMIVGVLTTCHAQYT